MKNTLTRRCVAYGYGRVSHDEEEQFYSPQAQREKIEGHYRQEMLAKDSSLLWGDVYFDEASAKKALVERLAGRQLNLRMVAGDHVVVARSDRAFRSVKDELITIDCWHGRGIIIHLLDIPYGDSSTPEWRMVVSMLGVMAEFQRLRTGQQTADALRWKGRKKLPVNGSPPIGWRIAGEKRQGRFVPCEEERQQAAEFVELYNQFGWWRATLDLMKRKVTFRERPADRINLTRMRRAVQQGFPLPGGGVKAGQPAIEHFV